MSDLTACGPYCDMQHGPDEPHNAHKVPRTKYRLTLVIDGNSHEEIEHELVGMTRGGYLLDSDYYKRDEFKVYDGRKTSRLEHTNPEQTPENYSRELTEWHEAHKAARAAR